VSNDPAIPLVSLEHAAVELLVSEDVDFSSSEEVRSDSWWNPHLQSELDILQES